MSAVGRLMWIVTPPRLLSADVSPLGSSAAHLTVDLMRSALTAALTSGAWISVQLVVRSSSACAFALRRNVIPFSRTSSRRCSTFLRNNASHVPAVERPRSRFRSRVCACLSRWHKWRKSARLDRTRGPCFYEDVETNKRSPSVGTPKAEAQTARHSENGKGKQPYRQALSPVHSGPGTGLDNLERIIL
jgi:hypothetical protein